MANIGNKNVLYVNMWINYVFSRIKNEWKCEIYVNFGYIKIKLQFI